jgi:hypothetical protein
MVDTGALRLVMTRMSLRANVAKECGVRTGHTVFLSPFLDTVSEDDNAQVVIHGTYEYIAYMRMYVSEYLHLCSCV